MQTVRLRCEYLENPVGIDIKKPRFFWNCEGSKEQSAYQILCRRDGEVIWDSGKRESAEMTHISYEGKALKSGDIVEWSVKLWDENGEAGEWSTASFEMGLLEQSDWKASWIRGDYKVRKNVRYPVDCFKQEILLAQKVKKARLYITACGLYEAQIDGKKVGEFCLAPGSTDYRKRIQYQTYDITEMLSGEKATFTVELADGWYRGSVAAYGFTKAYGKETKLLYQMEIIYEDGTRDLFLSDGQTAWSGDGELRFADLKDGEICEAGRKPSYRGKAVPAKAPEGVLVASDNVIPKKKEEFSPKLIITPKGERVLDFGQNIAGFLSFRIKGKKGQTLRLRLGEILDENGEFTQKNFQVIGPNGDVGAIGEMQAVMNKFTVESGKGKLTPLQEIQFTCSGGEDSYCTKFAVFGFRYAKVETGLEIDPAAFKAIAVYSDMEQTGDFCCSNEKVNQFYRNTVWSMKGNFLDVPTDCPTRERLGWTGDGQIFFNTGSYMMDTAAFYRKWMRDLLDAQDKKGLLPAVAPFSKGSMMYNTTGQSVGWADAIYLLPYRFYKMYGDRQILVDCYPAMKKYADYMVQNTGYKNKKQGKNDPNKKYVFEKGFHLGEWLEPEEFVEVITAETSSSMTKVSRLEEATAYFHLTMETMREIAGLLGYTGDEKRYEEYAKGSAKAYASLFLKEVPDTDRQAKLIRPLALGCVPEEKKKAVQERLVQAVEHRRYRIGTGFLSTPFVLGVLTEAGRTDLAYKMLENEEAPGWLAEVNAGATTVWEDWQGDASHNHYSPGSVCEWMYNTILGIRVTGNRKFTICPTPGGTLTDAEGHYDSIYGRVLVRWHRENGKTTCKITVPENTTAEICFQGKTMQTGAGTVEISL